MFNFSNKSKLSSYNVLTPSDDGMILYNQITGSMVILSKDEERLYESIKQDSLWINRKFFEFLKNGGFLIPKDRDEIQFMDEISKENRKGSGYKSLTIAPTDKCNLDCTYCFEAKDQWISMPDQVIDQVEVFFDNFVGATPTKAVSVTWFGGEPTLHIKAVERLSKFFFAKTKELGIKTFNQSMITNGTTLNKPMRDKLIGIGCRQIQITVDGDKESHDNQRPYRLSLKVIKEKTISASSCSSGGCGSGSGCGDTDTKRSSFDQIFDNLKGLWEDGFMVSLRVNVGGMNPTAFEKVKKHIDSLGFSKPSIRGGVIHAYAARVHGEGDKEITQQDYSKTHTRSTLRAFTGTACMADTPQSFGISQNGKLSKCWHHITNEEHTVGTVYDLDIAKGFIDDYSPVKDKECRECAVLPSCWGGCKANNHTWEDPHAKKYEGCSTARWNLNDQVLSLYQSKKDHK